MLEFSRMRQSTAPANEALDVTDAKIMIVDDESINVDMVQLFLEEQGFKHFVALTDSRQAMAVLEDTGPDLLLLDLMMPKVTGFEILGQVRNHPKFGYLPVIILTAATDMASRLEALGLGATDFLAKPLDQYELALRVRNTLWAKAYQDQLAYYDALTQLPNRQLFLEELSWAVKRAARHNEPTALFCIEIDNFDTINDTIGHTVGDEVLRIVAQRIQGVIRDADLLSCSVGSDPDNMRLFQLGRSVYSLLLPRLLGVDGAAAVAERIIGTVQDPLQAEGAELSVTLSIGIATCPNETTLPTELLRLSSTAKDFAKKLGGNAFQFSSAEINKLYSERAELEAMLRKALERREFELYFQPKADVDTGVIVGAEALIRWNSSKGMVMPGNFIALAEETGLIVPIGEWCLMESCRLLKEWHESGKQIISLAVNLSTKQFVNAGFMARLIEIIAASGVDSRYLTLEITESLLIDNVDEKLKLLQSLKNLGVKLSIDDFGTGYSSLSYLCKLPVDELKIDRSFLKGIRHDASSRSIVSTVVFLAKKLGLQTVAEGVEELEELQFLQQLGCDHYQGLWCSGALPEADFFRKLPDKV